MSRLRVLAERSDLLAEEAARVVERRLSWRGRLRELGDDYGTAGGSAGDRRAIVEAMAAIEEGSA